MTLPRLSIGRPVGVAMFFLAVIMLGLISFARLPIDLLPEIAYPRLVVYTPYPDVAPAEVERLLTDDIEAQVSTVPGVERVESISREGLSLVTLRFAWGTDMDFAALAVRERLDNLRDQLPELAERPVVLRTDPSADPVLALSISGSSDLWGLKDLAETVFRRRLEQIDGIAQAGVTGGLEREIQVEVDPHKLEAYGVTVGDVSGALRTANVSRPGGTIRMGRYRYALRTLGEFQAVQEILDVPVRRSGGGPGGAAGAAGDLRIRDVAHVRDGFKERESIARYNGQEAVGLLLFKEAGANTVQVTETVEEVLAQLRAEYPDLSIDVAMAQAGFISESIANVVQALVLGGVLAFLVLFLFLRDARYPVAIALAIPISVVGTFALLDAFGVSLNIMSLGGLALGVGMLVDNSIVVLENVFRHREARLEEGPGAHMESAAVGAEEVTSAITASTLTTIAVFGPIIYVQGVAGELFGALSIAVAASLLASLLVAVTLLPALAARWTGHVDPAASWLRRVSARAGARAGGALGRFFRPLLDGFDRAFDRFAARYHGVLASALERRGRVVAITGILLIGTLLLLPLMSRSVLPDVEQGSFRVNLELPRGTPLERTAATAAQVERVLMADEDVHAVMARIGRQSAVGSFQEEESGVHTARLEVQLRPGGSTPEVIERVRAGLGGLPEGTLAFETGEATALGRLLGSAEGADLAIQVRGENLESMLGYAAQLESRLRRVPELGNVRLGIELGQPEVRL
ncbi:MAG TPA: efflux RND transporter permease subunit, partial [Longimicrobiales bacterium]|nr:efflux RND transporter permease subunit [Longimicrobiales bacterium]